MMTTATQEKAAVTTTKTEIRATAPTAFRAAGQSEKTAFEADVLVQLKANLAQLEDLHGRLKFAMSELAYLVKKS